MQDVLRTPGGEAQTMGFGQKTTFSGHNCAQMSRSNRLRREPPKHAQRQGQFPHHNIYQSQLRRNIKPNFRTMGRAPDSMDMKRHEAKTEARHHEEAPTPKHKTIAVGRKPKEFRLNFHLDDNQNLRRKKALDHAGLMDGAAMHHNPCHEYDPRDDGKPKFQVTVPSTANPVACLQRKIDACRDQGGMFMGGTTINDHTFREEDKTRAGMFKLDFHIPDCASRREMATRKPFPVFDQPEHRAKGAPRARVTVVRPKKDPSSSYFGVVSRGVEELDSTTSVMSNHFISVNGGMRAAYAASLHHRRQ